MNIFEYTRYKAYLRDTIASFPKKGRGQINKIAAHLRVHPTLLSQVLNGDRDLSAEQIHSFCGYLGLPPLESDYLILLLQYERAGNAEFKKYYKTKIDEIKKSSLNISKRLVEHHRLTDYEKSVFYSSWIYLAVWLFTSVNEGQTIESVAERFTIPRSYANEILIFLKNSNLCTEASGTYLLHSQHIHLEYGSAFLARHHSNWRLKAIQRCENLSEEEMMFTSPFSISKSDFIKIREDLMRLIKATSKVIRDSPAEDIACMNLDLFWIRN